MALMATEEPDRRDAQDGGGEWLGLVFLLLVIGWAVWAVGIFFLSVCEGLQSNPGLTGDNSGDPCASLGWAVFLGFFFLVIATILTFTSRSKPR